MNAKLYTSGNQMEVRVSNKSYASAEGEDKKAFLKRVKGELEKDFDEAIEIKDISTESLEKLSDAILTEAFKVSKGLQEQILLAILSARGIEVAKIEKTARAKVQKIDLEVVKVSAEYLTAKSNVGKAVAYTPTAKGDDKPEQVSGIVKSISLNKTNTIIYYNIMAGTVLRCCSAKNETLEFFEI
jgi:hypothetical protein